MSDQSLVMEISFPGGMKVDAHYRGFNIKTDQGPDNGGDASAPEPFVLFLASLATCTGVYVLGFCQAREIPTDGLSMRQKMVPGPDGKGLAAVELELILPPEFPEKYEKAVLRVASQCAVKKAILNPPEITLKAVRA